MKVFITGATGYIGNAVARTFRRAGHDVYGLTRSQDKANLLWQDEIKPVIGDLNKSDTYASIAKDAEILIHAAADMGNDMANLDRTATERFVGWAKDTNRQRTFIYTSGCWVYGNTKNEKVTEASALNPLSIVSWRPAIEELVLKGSTDRLTTLVLRPGVVYGGKGGLTSGWFQAAEKDGVTKIVGEGYNRWPMVHVEDLANAYLRAALFRTKNEIFNVTDRSRYTVREMAQNASRATGKNADVKVWSLTDAAKTLGQPFADALVSDQHVDSWKAINLLGWNPHFGGFVDDAEQFYNAWKHARR
jgi:nucleoside-diphosphate-sugar epimerase